MKYLPFFQKDESDVLGPFSSFEQRFNFYEDSIRINKEKYEYFSRSVDEAEEQAVLDADNQDDVIVNPNFTATNEDDLILGPKPVSIAHDEDVFATSINVSGFIDEDEYLQNVHMLNRRQQMMFWEMLSHLRQILYDPSVPLKHCFCGGSAGTGKSLLIKCLQQGS